MKYIDKTIPEIKQKAHELLKKFIDGQWQQDDNRYINLAYKHFKNGEFRELLLNEQKHYCCYCMKHILNTETTLEHIIPDKAIYPAIFDQYNSFGDINANVFFWQDNMRTSKINIMPPFPHILAYENLVASCNGHIPKEGYAKCCNRKRGSKNIIPVFYLSNANMVFEYDINGIIICDEKYNNTISCLDLEHTTLQLFRRCWLNLPSQYDALDVINASTDEELRNQIIDDINISIVSISDRATIRTELYWSSFMNYFWFYLYKLDKGL
ncbi:MAG: hypothetical protein LBF17_01520 [Mediterranea sp.]|jgi:hypothetical protein|nr:hypothetical protein [Mediterranea sp.]